MLGAALDLQEVAVAVHVDAGRLHVRELLAKGHEVPLVELPHVRGRVRRRGRVGRHGLPGLGREPLPQRRVHLPRALGVVGGVAAERLGRRRVRLHAQDVQDGLGLAAGRVHDLLLAEELGKEGLHAHLARAVLEQVPRERLERVAVAALGAQARRVEEARHVHRVAREAAQLKAHVLQHVAVEAVVVPDLPRLRVLEELLELAEDRRVRAVDEEGLALASEAVLEARARVDREARDHAVAHGPLAA
mmetsp:Transcript_2849/g.8306  ORF Transcript_2849/g.8306 Transcript_2849/m.8306 type:complete len:247 (+) Transcript_2849:412-1152(+)